MVTLVPSSAPSSGRKHPPEELRKRGSGGRGQGGRLRHDLQPDGAAGTGGRGTRGLRMVLHLFSYGPEMGGGREGGDSEHKHDILMN